MQELKTEMERASIVFPDLTPQEHLQLAFDLSLLPLEDKQRQYNEIKKELDLLFPTIA